MAVLGIETSCDETAAAVCRNGEILATVVNSQEIHRRYGGVVPEIASREHERYLNTVVWEALGKAGLSLNDLNGIAVTRGPGLAGTLLTGVCFAKGLAGGRGLPLVGVNHLEAHIFANFLADPQLQFPFICLLVSGGHTQLWHVMELGKYRLLGESRDDAAGEAFDKGARILGLKYPGGPEIERVGREGDPTAVVFPRAFINDQRLEFSFSGLKTALLYYMNDFDAKGRVSLADVASSYQAAIIDVLVAKLRQALKTTGARTCVIAGGVAANQLLRRQVRTTLPDEYKVLYPDLDLCTDNGAMIAYLGEIYLQAGRRDPLDFPVEPNFPLPGAQ